MRGRSELQAGAVMVLGSTAALLALRAVGTSPSPSGSGVVFTGQGFVTAVTAIVLFGILAVGALLLLLGVVLWFIQRAQDARIRAAR